ncbi:MAG: penicillin-binding protein activator [Candidatus Pacebacteria bacterium]|nr:penicillin-binding protein activator [Candidatus Paceibacterota bacterium]
MNKNKQIIASIIVGVIIIAGVWYSVATNKANTPQANESIKIGAILPLTGDGASYGDVWKRSIELGRGEIEAKYGQKVEVIYEDSQMKPADAATAASKLVSTDKVKAIIIGTSRETLAVAPIAEQNKVLVLAGATSPEVTKAGDYIFRTIPSDLYQGNDLADFAIRKGYAQMAVLFLNDEYGKGITDVFGQRLEAIGGKVVAKEEFQAQGASDYRTQLTKIAKENPNAVLIIASQNQYALILKQMKELNINLPVLAGEAFKDQTILDSAKELAEGVIFTAFVDPQTPEGAKFDSLYKEKYASQPGPYAAEFFDNTELLLTALIESRGDIEKAKEWLYAIKDWRGATGTTNFDANGDVIGKSYTIYTVKNGQFVPYQQ